MLLGCAPMVVQPSSLSLFATGAPLAAAVTTTAVKRGSEELLAHGNGTAVNNGNSLNAHSGLVENNNDAKKAKLDKSATRPSKVIHVRNIPTDCAEAEVIHLGIPFGRITNVLVLKGKNQAFLEMADESAAASMVNYFTTCTANIRGRAVYVQFSNHKELKTDQTHSNSNASAQAALQAAQALSGNSDTQGGPNTVLRVIIEHMLYPITLDVLHQIFSRYGNVLKIVTFTKNNSFQVLIQYPDVVSAQSAKLSLDGQNIYNSCCTLRIEFSKLTSLNVKYNNDKSRDYTNPTLPNGDTSSGMDALALSDQILPQIFLAGNPAALQLASGRRSITQNERLGGGIPLGNFPLSNNSSNLHLAGQLGGTSCVLLVSNLNEEMVSPDALFTLFGVYGDVLRVKILYNKKDCALIQMAEPQQAQLAMLHMDKLRLFGKEIRVMQSKYQTVQLPKEGQPDAGLTKDYTLSPLHRFKKPGSKNYQNIYSPSATLHLSNIPQNISEEELKAAFQKNGFEVRDFRFFPKDRRMALLQLNSIDDAVAALIKMHNYQLGETSHLRVSFSKTNIHPETTKIQQ